MTDSLKSLSRLQVLLHPALSTGLSGSLASLLAGEDMPVSRKLAGNSCRFIKQGESPGMADHESESNQGCLLSDLSLLARSWADGSGCLCTLNDSPSQLFRERQLCRPSFWKWCLCSLPHTGWSAFSHHLQRQGQASGSYPGLHRKQERARDYNERLFPRSPSSGRGKPQSASGLGSLQALSLMVPKSRSVDQCHSIRMNMKASSWVHWHSQGLLPSVILITNPQNWYESLLKPDKEQQQ